MISRFNDFIGYVTDNIRTGRYLHTVVIDSFVVEKNMKIYVLYHTNRYDINTSLELEEFYSTYYENLNRDQLKICTTALKLREVYFSLSKHEEATKDLIYKMIKKELIEYEQHSA